MGGKPQTALLNTTASEIKVLERHLEVLKTVQDNAPVGIIKLSRLTGHPQHAVRYSLRILEKEGLIIPSGSGAVPTEDVPETLGTLDEALDDLSTTLTDLKTKLKK